MDTQIPVSVQEVIAMAPQISRYLFKPLPSDIAEPFRERHPPVVKVLTTTAATATAEESSSVYFTIA